MIDEQTFESLLADYDVHADIIGPGAIVLHFANIGVLSLSIVGDDQLAVRGTDIVVEGETAEQRRVRHLELGRIAQKLLGDGADIVRDPHGTIGTKAVLS